MPIVPLEHGLGSSRYPYQQPALLGPHRVLKLTPPCGACNGRKR